MNGLIRGAAFGTRAVKCCIAQRIIALQTPLRSRCEKQRMCLSGYCEMACGNLYRRDSRRRGMQTRGKERTGAGAQGGTKAEIRKAAATTSRCVGSETWPAGVATGPRDHCLCRQALSGLHQGMACRPGGERDRERS